MKVVEMILKAHGLTHHNTIVENCCHDTTPFLFCGKAFDENVYPRRDHERGGVGAVDNGIRFLGRRFWPLDETAVEVSWIDKRNGVGTGLCTQPATSTKVHNATRTHRES